ncbi:sodium:solute symporter family transporter [Halobellus rarus]|uniref:Uncharacterized protein n=1 Tax=Halobellus rarus TaxID=1126237 RepID=A0ABD6CRE1_9EURY
MVGFLISPGIEGSSADTAILRSIQDMPGPFLGIMMAAAVAAAMSTADSIILMLGSIISRYIYQVLIQGDMPEKQLSRYLKITPDSSRSPHFCLRRDRSVSSSRSCSTSPSRDTSYCIRSPSRRSGGPARTNMGSSPVWILCRTSSGPVKLRSRCGSVSGAG